MNIVLWILQGILAVMFMMAGFMKVSKTKAEMADKMAWVEDFSQSQIRTIGVLEILAAIGLILPFAFGIMPYLTPFAAVGLVLTMIGAAITHQRRGETQMMGMNIMLLLLAAFVAYGRFVLSPF